MNKFTLFLFLTVTLFLGCGEDIQTGGWTCWMPETDIHNGPCVDECEVCYCSYSCFGIEE
jgi:hypothetical protein